MNVRNQDSRDIDNQQDALNFAIFKAEANEKITSISSQIKEVSTLARELLDQIGDLKLGVGMLTHSIKTLEADHENQSIKRESQARAINEIITRFDGIIVKIDDIDSRVSTLEVYAPLMVEITEQRNQNIARATTLQNSFISSLGGSMGDVVKWFFMGLIILGLSNAGAIMSAITGNNQEPKPEPNHESR